MSISTGGEFEFADPWVEPASLLRDPPPALLDDPILLSEPPPGFVFDVSELTFDTEDGEREVGEAPLILRRELDRRRREYELGSVAPPAPDRAVSVDAVVRDYVQVEYAIPSRPPTANRRLLTAAAGIMLALTLLAAAALFGR